MFNDLSKMKAVVLCILLFLKSSSFIMYNILEKGQMKVFTCKLNNKDNSSNRLIKTKLRSFQKEERERDLVVPSDPNTLRIGTNITDIQPITKFKTNIKKI